MIHVIYAVLTVVLCIAATLGLMLIVSRFFAGPITVAAGVFGWVTSMWLFGHIPHWFVFNHYPFWLVVLAGLGLVVTFLAIAVDNIAAVTVAGLLVIGLVFYGLLQISVPKHHHGVKAASGQTSTTSSSTTSTTAPKKHPHKPRVTYGLSTEDQKQICHKVWSKMGWKCSEVKMAQGVNFNANPEERGSAAFSKHTLKTPADIAAFLHGSSVDSQLARARIKQALAAYPGEYQRALTGAGYVPVQFTVEAQYFGTTYVHGNTVLNETGARQVGPNDILWLYITRPVKGISMIVPAASIRADCGNPHFTKIVPVRPGTPSAPPIQTPPPFVKCPNPLPPAGPYCGTPLSGPDQTPVQFNHRGHTPGYERGRYERNQAAQPVGTRNPGSVIPPNSNGYNSGCSSCAPKGGDTSTGQVGSTDGSSGGTHGSDQGTEGSDQTSSGTVSPPP